MPGSYLADDFHAWKHNSITSPKPTSTPAQFFQESLPFAGYARNSAHVAAAVHAVRSGQACRRLFWQRCRRLVWNACGNHRLEILLRARLERKSAAARTAEESAPQFYALPLVELVFDRDRRGMVSALCP